MHQELLLLLFTDGESKPPASNLVNRLAHKAENITILSFPEEVCQPLVQKLPSTKWDQDLSRSHSHRVPLGPCNYWWPIHAFNKYLLSIRLRARCFGFTRINKIRQVPFGASGVKTEISTIITIKWKIPSVVRTTMGTYFYGALRTLNSRILPRMEWMCSPRRCPLGMDPGSPHKAEKG